MRFIYVTNGYNPGMIKSTYSLWKYISSLYGKTEKHYDRCIMCI